MRVTDFSRASFASRLIVVFAFTLLFIFTALLVLDNKEIQKLLPHSHLRSVVLLLGYSTAILSTNYVMALRGRNLTHWLTEALISANFVLFFTAMTLPSLFPLTAESVSPWWRFWQDDQSEEPNNWLYTVLILQIPLLAVTVGRVKAFFLSGGEA